MRVYSILKRCPKCGNEFPRTREFWHRDVSTYDECASACTVCVNKTARRAGRRSPEQVKRNNLHQLYGITSSEYDMLRQSQNGECAICGRDLGPGHGTNVDHNHDTGKVRGLLCLRCNVALAYVEDDEFLVKLLGYLERS